MKIRLLFLSLCVSIGFTSCMSVDSDPTVLQKSVPDTPQWLTQNGKPNSKSPQFINIIFRKEHVLNLPLGLKQAQATAILRSSSLVLNIIENDMLNSSEKANINQNNKDQYALKNRLSQSINKHREDVKIDLPLAEDVYWEYRQQESPHDNKQYYVVWVLLLVPKTVYDKALHTIADEFQNTNGSTVLTLQEGGTLQR